MSWDSENISAELFELSSEQRLGILQKLSKNKLNNSKLAEILGATKPEIHRNVSRLSKSGLIEKDTDGNYSLTTYGKAALVLIQSVAFFSENKSYFNKHTLGNLDEKFIQRLGALQNKKNVKGYVKTIEKWRQIHENAEKYIHNILSEVPYSGDIVEVISKQLKNKIEIHSIFSENVIMPEERKKIFEEKGFQKYIQNGNLQRKIKKDVTVAVLVTDKEAAVFFPDFEGEIDLSQMFYSVDPEFREWCYDYFEWSWSQSTLFQETKLI